ncbi:MAG TPA: energy transducer TonB [Candidatus Didemnitutus sp.]|nr:energy transducer TonB [Candidatus Didemnitutus sp.]
MLATRIVSAEPEDTAQLLGLSKYTPPQFPAMASDEAITSGYATMAVSWDEQGNPSDIIALRSSNPYFVSASTDAIRTWRRLPELADKGTGIYELTYQISGVVVCSNKSLRAFQAKSRPSEPLKIATLDELDAQPRALTQPMPAFPAAAAGKWEQGKVVVEFFVDEQGHVRAPSVQESTAPEFSSEALAALRQWRFETPKKNGKPVVYSQRWSFDFRKTG